MGMQWFNNLLFPSQCRFVDLIEGGAPQLIAVQAAIRMDKKLSGEPFNVADGFLTDAAKIDSTLTPLLVRKMRAQVRRLVHA